MTVTPAGILIHSYLLREMVAACATFQAVVGAASATLAKERIYYPAAEGEDEHPWPRAVVSHSLGFGRTRTGLATWETVGSLKLSLELIVPSEEASTVQDSYNWFANKLGAIISEMEALSGTGEPVAGQTHLNLSHVMLEEGPYIEPISEISHLETPEEMVPYVAWWAVCDVGFL